MENLNTEIQVSIFEITGRTMQKTNYFEARNEIEINTSDLKPGIYFIRFDSSSFRQVEKLVVE
jgi:hypothetical protein